MSKRVVRVILSVVIIGGSLGAVMMSSLREEARYFKNVDEVMPQPQAWYGKNLKLRGFVENPLHRPGSLDYRFTVKHGDHSVLASYTGLVPDNFKEGAEVVLTGRLAPDGFHVEPNGIVGKCPSKYEEQGAAAKKTSGTY